MTKVLILIALGFLTLAASLPIIIARRSRWPDWTGFHDKTLWAWLQLLIIPIVFWLGVSFYNQAQGGLTRELEANRMQERSLQTYFDRMTPLILDGRLLANDEAFAIARAQTQSVLRDITSDRLGRLIQFLHETNLLRVFRVDLEHLDFRGADLGGVDLGWGADLEAADLSHADLEEADLRGATLERANLKEADLEETDLRMTDLRDVKHLTQGQINGACLDKQTQLPHGLTFPNAENMKKACDTLEREREEEQHERMKVAQEIANMRNEKHLKQTRQSGGADPR